jgi:hypothetical protein
MVGGRPVDQKERLSGWVTKFPKDLRVVAGAERIKPEGGEVARAVIGPLAPAPSNCVHKHALTTIPILPARD